MSRRKVVGRLKFKNGAVVEITKSPKVTYVSMPARPRPDPLLMAAFESAMAEFMFKIARDVTPGDG